MSDQVMPFSHIVFLSQVGLIMGCFFRPADVEKRANPVCHFVTPLDGNIESDMNRSSEVKVGKKQIMMCKIKSEFFSQFGGLPSVKLCRPVVNIVSQHVSSAGQWHRGQMLEEKN